MTNGLNVEIQYKLYIKYCCINMYKIYKKIRKKLLKYNISIKNIINIIKK